MTIRFLTAHNGYDDQSIKTLPASIESDLVSGGIAEYFSENYRNKFSDSIIKEILQADSKPASAMASPPTVTSGTSATLTTGLTYVVPGATDGGGFESPGRQSGPITICGRSLGNDLTAGTGATPDANVTTTYIFDFDGTEFELKFGGSSTTFLVKVDNEYVTRTPISTGTSGYTFHKITFAARERHRITIIGQNLSLQSISIDATATIRPAAIRGLKLAVVGDSFGAQGPLSYIAAIMDISGFDDIWSFSVGGTGWVADNAGSSKSYKNRISDVINAGPFDAVWYIGSVNDDGKVPAEVAAAIIDTVGQVADAMPSALQIISPTASLGVGSWAANKLDVMDAMRDAANAAGAIWANPLEQSLQTIGSWVATATSSAKVAGATVLGMIGFGNDATPSAQFPAGATIEIGAGSTRERVQIKSVAQSGWVGGANVSDPIWVLTLMSPLQYDHPGGSTLTMVPGPYITGTATPATWVGNTFYASGKVFVNGANVYKVTTPGTSAASGGPTGTGTDITDGTMHCKYFGLAGFGNSQVYTSTDGVHPVDAGAIALASAIISELQYQLRK